MFQLATVYGSPSARIYINMASFYHYVAKAVHNRYDATEMRWWRTNFNMPVPNLFNQGTATWQEYIGPCDLYHINGPYDFSATDGNYAPIPGGGYEALVLVATYHWDAPQVGGNTVVYAQARNPSSTVIGGPYTYSYTVQPASGSMWWEYCSMFNLGVAPWEIATSGTYYHDMWTTGYNATGTTTMSWVCNNVPTNTQSPGSTYSGSIWVEGNNLCYVDANGWKQSITGSVQSSPGATAGSMWIDTSNNLCWVGTSGNVYAPPNKIQQFASTWTNGAPGSIYAPGHEGSVWIDNQFGDTHIAYIGNNGYKWLTGDGANPYVAYP